MPGVTEKLYDTDSYLKEFQAQVIECRQEDNSYQVVLDKTAFFPEGGGQSSDTGLLGGIRVLDVQESGGIVYHKTEQSLAAGETVTGVLDYEDRFSKMQQHTGEHIVSGFVHKKYGYDNVGFHLGSQAVTMDFNGVLTEVQLREVEYLANEAAAANVRVDVRYPEREELAMLDYRSKIEIDGPVRIVTIGDYDSCACCAPHVKRTGEVGMIRLIGAQKYKGGTRVSMLCGFRALADYIEKEKSVNRISVLLSAKPEMIADAVNQVKQDAYNLKGRILELQQELIQCKMDAIPDHVENLCFFEKELDAGAMRQLVNLGIEKCTGYCSVFSGTEADGFRYVIGSRTEDCRNLSKQLNEAFNGRGGGKPQMVQGSLLGTEEEIRKFFV